jgi:hypothetical protein
LSSFSRLIQLRSLLASVGSVGDAFIGCTFHEKGVRLGAVRYPKLRLHASHTDSRREGCRLPPR